MKVLQICSATEMGGGEVHVADLVRGLTERGHAVYLAVRPDSPLREALSGVIASWHELPLRNSLDVQSARAIGEILSRNKIDIMHAHMGRDYLVAALARRHARDTKLVLTRHHYLPIKRNPIYRWFLADAAAVIAVSENIRETIIERLQLQPERVRTIPNWIDPERFNPIARETARPLFHVRANLAVACIGQISAAKGQEEFIRAAAHVAQIRHDVEFLIVGEEPDSDRTLTSRLMNLAKEMGLSGRLRFLGYIDRIPELLAAVDVVVVPSWDEGFSLVTIEAMAARRAVIASRTGGILGIVRHSETGLLFPPRDVKSLSEKLLWLISDAPLRERLAAQGQKDVYGRFNREQIIDQIEGLYSEVLEG